jgi:hypothetical protein
LANLPTISKSICQLTEFTEKICDPRGKTLILREQARRFLCPVCCRANPSKRPFRKSVKKPDTFMDENKPFRHPWIPAHSPGWVDQGFKPL